MKKYLDIFLFITTALISYGAIVYFFLHGNQNLANYDAIARLNISRRVIDSMTPGVGQLGGIWLPFPQILTIPFIWNDFFWHTGIAGAIISGVAFMYSAVYLQKTAFLITKNLKASLIVWFLFVTNVNILLLQTMALSESFFFFCLVMVLFSLTKWMKTHTLIHFLAAAFFVMLITLTRYEGYFVFIAAVLTVFIECIRIYLREGFSKVEGMVLLFLTIAGFGIFLWCIYCALFFKDPLYWLHVYSYQKKQITTAVQLAPAPTAQTLHTSFLGSIITYSGAIFLTNGIITVVTSAAGLLFMTYACMKSMIKKRSTSIYTPLLFTALIVYLFLIYGYHIGFIPHITFPPKLLKIQDSSLFSRYSDTNIRYGIVMAPIIVLLAGIMASRNKWLLAVVGMLAVFQLIMNIYQPQVFQYSFPNAWQYPITEEAPWVTSHYDGGLILISANKHEDLMFQTGLPFKDFIYEGSREYWTTSLNNPAKYATWVIYNKSILEDGVSDYLTPHAYDVLQKQFQLVYDRNGYKIYHIRK